MTTLSAQRICIAIVDDDPDTRDLIRRELETLHFGVREYPDGTKALEGIRGEATDLVILDIGLPDMDGFEVCRQLRSSGSEVPIIFVTSRAEEIDRVSGFALGADDYVSKPFSSRELGFRVKALLRRSLKAPSKSPSPESASSAPSKLLANLLVFGPLSIDPDKRRVVLHDKPMSLTALEFDVLLFLAENPGRPFSRDELMEQVWGLSSTNYGPTVTTLLNRLRRKLEPDVNNPTFILTVYGVGYRFVDPTVDPIPA